MNIPIAKVNPGAAKRCVVKDTSKVLSWGELWLWLEDEDAGDNLLEIKTAELSDAEYAAVKEREASGRFRVL